MGELDGMTPSTGLGIPDKPLSDMSDGERDRMLAGESSVAEQLGNQDVEPASTGSARDVEPAPEPTPEPETTPAAEKTSPADDRTNLQQFGELIADQQGGGEEDSELARLRADNERLRTEHDKRRDSELENAYSLLRGEAKPEADTDGAGEIDYSDPALVSYYERQGLDHEQATSLTTSVGRMVEERARQIAGSEVDSLRKEFKATKDEGAAKDKIDARAREVATGMTHLAKIGGTSAELVREYMTTGKGYLWDYLNQDAARLSSASTVYDAGLALSAIVDTSVGARSSANEGNGGGSTSLPAEGSDRGQRLEEVKTKKSWEEGIADGLSESARPFRGKIKFLDTDYLQEGGG